MTHEEAIRANKAEGYLLGDLSGEERDAFEEHYIDCRVCSATIRSGAVMLAAGREVVHNERRFRPQESLAAWLPKVAAAVLAVVVGVQGYVIFLLRRPPLMEFMAPGVFITGTTRAGGTNQLPPIHFQGDEPVKVSVLIDSGTPYPRYRLELRDPSGKSLFVFHATDEQVRSQEGEALSFLLRPLPAGRYVLLIEGVRKEGNRLPIDSQVIVVQ